MSESTHQFQAGRRINAQNIEQNEPDLLAAKVVEQGQSEQPSKDSDELIEPEIDIEPVYKKSKWQTLKGLFALSFIVLILLEFAFSIVLAFQQSVILGGVYLTAVITGVLLISRLLWREYRMLRSLKRNQLHRHEANRLLNSEQVGGAIPWLEKLNKHQQLDNFENFKNQVATHHSDKEIMSLYANSLLITQDNQAKS